MFSEFDCDYKSRNNSRKFCTTRKIEFTMSSLKSNYCFYHHRISVIINTIGHDVVEILESHEAVIVQVGLLEHRLDLLVRWGFSQVHRHPLQLIPSDSP